MRNHTIESAAKAACVSTKTIRRALRDPKRPLRHYRIGSRVVIAEENLHAWLELHAVNGVPAAVVDRISPAARAVVEGLV